MPSPNMEVKLKGRQKAPKTKWNGLWTEDAEWPGFVDIKRLFPSTAQVWAPEAEWPKGATPESFLRLESK